jgi:hypothetical protein
MFNCLLLCMFRSLYYVYCLCVNVCCAAATGCHPNCGFLYIYIYIYIYIYHMMLRVIFPVVLRRMVFNSRRFGTLCFIFIGEWILHIHISTRLWRWNRHSVPKRRLLNTIRRRTAHCVCSIFIGSIWSIHTPMKMDQTQCSETSAIKHNTPENNPKDYTRHSEHGESLKSRDIISYHMLSHL